MANQTPPVVTNSSNPDELPIIGYLDQITQTVRDNPATVIIGPTGSGKTTQVGLHLLRQGLAGDKRIGVTQPRRLAVISLAEYVSQLYGCAVGEEVGYQVRFDDATMEGTRLKFMTDGILLQEAAHDPLFSRYQVLIFDEAHEQGLNTDLCIGLAKRAMQQRPDLKVIVMSATIDTGRFSEYFDNAPVIEVEGRTFPIATEFLQPDEYRLAATMCAEPVDEVSLPALAAYKVHQIVYGALDEGGSERARQQEGEKELATSLPCNLAASSGHILVFMPGKKEIAQTIDYLEQLHLPDVLALPAHSEMDQAEQQVIFEPTDKRKVIVATNIAETSITVDDLAYVIDSGLIRQMIFDHKHGIGMLKTMEHSKSGLRQRMGRAGRTQPGTYLPLFLKKEWDTGRPQFLLEGEKERPEYSTPEIQREDLSSAVLRMTQLGISDIEQFDFLNPPAKGAVHNAIESLQTLGALDAHGNITALGQQMATLPVEPRIARMILEAEQFDCVLEIITIAACLSTGTVFVRPIGQETQADEARAKLVDRRGDLFTLLKIVPLYEKQKDREEWANLNFLNQHVLEEIIKIREQLRELLNTLDVPVTFLDAGRGNQVRREYWQLQYDRIGRAITAGLLQNLAVRSSDREYTRANGSTIRIHPGSVLADKKPPLIVCSEILELNGATFAVECQPVEMGWLMEIAPQVIKLQSVPLQHPWKGNVVGHYAVRSIFGIEVGREYTGKQLPRHMVAEERRQEKGGKRGRPAGHKERPKRFYTRRGRK